MGAAAPEAAAAERSSMRRRLFGYRPADVDEALTARDAELAELRRDVAALWLAFAQHDRMIRGAIALPERGSGPDRAEEAGPDAVGDPEAQPGPIGRQLSDLDEVLAAIETATQTLERTYSEEVGEGLGDAEDSAPGPQAEDELPPGGVDRPGGDPGS